MHTVQSHTEESKKQHNTTLTFLGTGSAFSKKFGNNSAVLTVTKNGVSKNLLIDCGRTVPDDLVKAGYSWSDIDAIFITHLHGDHVYGLEEAGFYGRYVLGKKPHLILPHTKIKNDLWEKVLKGTMAEGDLSRKMQLSDYFTYEVVDGKTEYFMFNDMMISVFITEHIKNKKSYGLIVGEYKFFVYTSDTLLNKDFLDAVAGDRVEAIFHDCQMKKHEGNVHASLPELLELDDAVKSKIYIMHYDDGIGDYYTQIKDGGLKIAIRYDKYAFNLM